MVSATKGILIRCDVPTKVFICHLDESRPTNERFVLDKTLDDQTVLIRNDPRHVEYIQTELKKYKQNITYQPPVEKK